MYSFGTIAAFILLGASAMYLLVLIAFNRARRTLPLPWFACCCVMMGIYCVAMLFVSTPGTPPLIINLVGPIGYATSTIFIAAALRFEELDQGIVRRSPTLLEYSLLLVLIASLTPGGVYRWDDFHEWVSLGTTYQFPRTTWLASICCLVISAALIKLIQTVAQLQKPLLLIGVFSVSLTGVNDMAISLELYEFNFMAAAGALVFLIAVALNESGKWGGETELLTELRESLEERVVERTAQLEEARMKLVDSERLAALGQLAASVGHEINNPLTYVLANLELLQDEPALYQDDRVEDAVEGAQRIAKIVEQLRDLSKPSQHPKTVCDAGKALTKAAKTLQPGLTMNRRLRLNSQQGAFVYGDEGRLTQLLVNLISNSLDSLPDDESNRSVVASIATVEDTVAISVVDEGTGISDELKAKMFEPFATGRTGGLGLGLAIVRRIIDEMNGVITVKDVEPHGTRIEVYLNRAPQPTTNQETRSPDSIAATGKRVLVIDDESSVLKSMRMLLRDYDVTTSTGGEEAVRLVREGRFDAIFCDLVMPEVSGLDLLNIGLESDPSISDRFILISGGIPSAELRSRVVGTHVRFLRKPFSQADLKRQLAMQEKHSMLKDFVGD